MYTLKLKHHFDSAHRLTNYQGACSNLHGHRWEVEIVINVPELKAQNKDMVIDFKVLKGIINEFDHAFLNDLVSFNPTAENITQYLHEKISNHLEHIYSEFKLEVTIWESPEASITYR